MNTSNFGQSNFGGKRDKTGYFSIQDSQGRPRRREEQNCAFFELKKKKKTELLFRKAELHFSIGEKEQNCSNLIISQDFGVFIQNSL